MNATQQPQTTDTDRLLDAARTVDALVAATTAADAHRPTPCTEWDVQDLTDHLVLVARRIRIVLQGGDFRDAHPTGAPALADVQAAWRDDLAALRAALPGVDLDRVVTAPFGTAPGHVLVAMYTGELSVHAWDLAAALGRTDALDQDAAARQLPLAQERIPAQREGFPFAPVVDVATDAPAYDRLVGWYGRDPRWSA